MHMKLSTRGRYGVTALFELALNYGRGVVPLRDIARHQGISEPYLEQLAKTLRQAGLVTSTRGAQGGYSLARPPEEITIAQAVEATEGPIALVDCLMAGSETKAPACEKAGTCVTRDVWARVCDSINQVLNSITLGDLVKDYQREKDPGKKDFEKSAKKD